MNIAYNLKIIYSKKYYLIVQWKHLNGQSIWNCKWFEKSINIIEKKNTTKLLTCNISFINSITSLNAEKCIEIWIHNYIKLFLNWHLTNITSTVQNYWCTNKTN